MAKLKVISALALASLLALSSDVPSSARPRDSGTKQTVLASVGEVHDGVLAALARDPRYAVKEDKDRIEAVVGADKPYSIVSVISRATNEESQLEVIYQGNGSPDDKARIERDFLQQVLEAIKYAETGYNRAPDLKSALDVGPRVDPGPSIPAVDNVRRY